MTPTLLSRRQAIQRIGLALGGIATAPVLSGLLGGCTTPSGEEAAAYAYQSLAEGQQQTLAALVDQIIPATDTPGAAESGVPQFIDKMLSEWYAPEERDAFLAGLAEVDARAEGGAFTGLEPDAQAALVAALDRETYPVHQASSMTDGDVAGAAQEGTYQAEAEAENAVAGMQGDLGESMAQPAPTGDEASAELNTGEGTASVGSNTSGLPFFRQLKELTLAGYYTSEVGASQELRWNPAPGRYDPDVPFSEIGRAWA